MVRLAGEASAAQRQSQKPKVTDTRDWKEILHKYGFFLTITILVFLT